MRGPHVVAVRPLYIEGMEPRPWRSINQSPPICDRMTQVFRTMTAIIGFDLELADGTFVTVRVIRVRDKLTGRTGRQVARTSEGRPVINWDDGGSNSRDPDTLERVR